MAFLHILCNEALSLISKHNKHALPKIQAIVSNPCFEIWFLLHYKYSTRSYVSNRGGKKAWEYIVDDIPANYFRAYAKGSQCIYSEIKDKHSESPVERPKKRVKEKKKDKETQ
jgi:hypothetical protein